MSSYEYASRQNQRVALYLDLSYLVGDGTEWSRAIVVTYLRNAIGQNIDRVRQYIRRWYGTYMADLPAIQVTDFDYLVNIPDHLSPMDIVNESMNWAPRDNIEVTKYDREFERYRPLSIRIIIHIKNIPL
jgi:hypothetical protein